MVGVDKVLADLVGSYPVDDLKSRDDAKYVFKQLKEHVTRDEALIRGASVHHQAEVLGLQVIHDEVIENAAARVEHAAVKGLARMTQARDGHTCLASAVDAGRGSNPLSLVTDTVLRVSRQNV